MQIRLQKLVGMQTKPVLENGGPANLIQGRRSFAIRVGDRLLGFSSQDVASVSLDVNQGSLKVQLLSEQGKLLADMQIPTPDVIRDAVRNLEEVGIHFEPQDRNELQQLLKQTMASSLPRSEFAMLVDEISHMAVQVSKPQAVQTEDLYPELTRQIRKLLQAMPEEIQRFVILNNAGDFPQEIWKTFQFISKVDAQSDPVVARFLAGQIPFSDKVGEKIIEIAARQSLNSVMPIVGLDPKALEQLVNFLAGKSVKGDSGLFDFPKPLAEFIFENHNLKLPDFTAASSFEELERNFLIQHQVGKLGAGSQGSALGTQLLRLLSTESYRALADFVVGKTGAPFSSEVKAELVHFLKNEPGIRPHHPLTSLDSRALERLEGFLRKNHPELLTRVTHSLELVARSRPSENIQMAANLAALDPASRLAFFVLDHLDPVRNSDLYQYFRSDHGLGRMTASLTDSLQGFLASDRFPPVSRGLDHFDPKRFEELRNWLKKHPSIAEPKTWLPNNPALRKGLLGMDPNSSPGNKAEALIPGTGLVRWDDDPEHMASHIYRELDGVPVEERNGLLTDALSKRLRHFKRIALLDQIWKAERLIDGMLGKKLGIHDAARDLSRTLNHVLGILGGEEDMDIQWDAWDRSAESKPNMDPRPSLRLRLLEENKGLSRYFKLDKWLPDQSGDLRQKVEGLSNLRRVEQFLQSIDNHRSDNHPKLLESLARFKSLLRELSQSAQGGEDGGLQIQLKSPFTARKQRQFQDFRERLLNGGKPDPGELFKEPFLRSEMGERAESLQRLEMKRLEPLFKDALSRLEKDPGETLSQLMRLLRFPSETSPQDAGSRLSGLMDILRDFNQNQNLNQQPMYLSLPLKFDNQESEMELACFKLPGGAKDRSRFLVVIHLDFPKWGHLRVDALKDQGSLSATFWVENPRTHHLLLDRLHELEDRLEAEGLGETMLTVKIEPQRAASSVASLCNGISNDGQVDMNI